MNEETGPMEDSLKGSKFVVQFTGDTSVAFLVDGWDAVLAKILEEISPDEVPDWWAGFVDGDLARPDPWVHDDFGPWKYQDEIRECCFLEITRING